MTKCLLALAVLVASAAAQQRPPIPASEVTLRKEIHRDPRVTIFLLNIPPGHATMLHRHDRDMLSVFVTGGRTRAVFNDGAPVEDTFAIGDVRFRSAGFTHSTENLGAENFLSVIFEFTQSQGQRAPVNRPPARRCTKEDQSACVEEKPILCATGFCIDEVSMAPRAVKEDGPSETERIFVAVSDYTLREEGEGRPFVTHARKTGDVQPVPAGQPRRWLNTAKTAARYMIVTFR